MTTALARLVGDVDAFARSCWGRRHHHHPPQPAPRTASPSHAEQAAFADLVTLGDIDRWASDTSAPIGDAAVRGAIPSSYRRADGAELPRSDPARLFAHFDQGHTVVLNGVNRHPSALAGWCHRLACEVGGVVDANVYLTPADGKGSGRHADAHGVFALQLIGTKRWSLWPTTARDADGDDPASIEVDLEPGDVLYVPPHWEHDVRTGSSISVHVTLGVSVPTWSQVLAAAVCEFGADGTREVLPLGFGLGTEASPVSDEDLASSLSTHLGDVAGAVGHHDPARMATWLRTRFGPPPLPVSNQPVQHRLALQDDDGGTRWRAAAGVWRSVRRDGEIMTVRLADRTLTMPGHLEVPLRRALNGDDFDRTDLAAWLDENATRELIGRLVREGLVVDTALTDSGPAPEPATAPGIAEPGRLPDSTTTRPSASAEGSSGTMATDATPGRAEAAVATRGSDTSVPGDQGAMAPDDGRSTLAERLRTLRVRVDHKVERVTARVVEAPHLLGEPTVEDLLALVAAHEHDFNPVEAYEEIHHEHRRSALLPPEHWLRDIDEFPDRVEAMVPRAVAELDLAPFTVAGINVQLTAHAHGNYFRIHSDASVGDHRRRRVSFVYYFHQDPKPFTGGELVLWDTEIVDGVASALDHHVVIEPQRDTMVLFDSRAMHEVRPVLIHDDCFANCRFTVNGWVR